MFGYFIKNTSSFYLHDSVLSIKQLLEQEPAIFRMPPRPRFRQLSSSDLLALRKMLLAKERLLAEPTRHVDRWREIVIRLIERASRHFPPFAFSDSPSTTYRVPLIDVCENAAKAIENEDVLPCVAALERAVELSRSSGK